MTTIWTVLGEMSGSLTGSLYLRFFDFASDRDNTIWIDHSAEEICTGTTEPWKYRYVHTSYYELEPGLGEV